MPDMTDDRAVEVLEKHQAKISAACANASERADRTAALELDQALTHALAWKRKRDELRVEVERLRKALARINSDEVYDAIPYASDNAENGRYVMPERIAFLQGIATAALTPASEEVGDGNRNP